MSKNSSNYTVWEIRIDPKNDIMINSDRLKRNGSYKGKLINGTIMKRVLLFFPLLIVLLSCISSRKMLELRHYDGAVAKSAQALMKNPDNQKEIDVLAQAYNLANDEDRQRLKFLMQSGEPQVWEEIYERYMRLENRQDLVKPLSTSIKQRINYTYVDYDKDIIESKRKAAEFLFSKGESLLAKGDRFNSRQAYDRFIRVKHYLPSFNGIDEKISDAYAKSFSHVLFQIRNNSGKRLSHAFEEDLLKIGLQDQGYEWIVFDTWPDPRIRYDFTITLNIRKIDISPELSTSAQFEETKEVEDGLEYVLDANGNVQKDSLGNDIKKIKYKTLRCTVIRFSLGKSATVDGTLDFLDNDGGQLIKIKSEPISAESKFDFVYALAKGNKEALSEETRRLTTLTIAPFPSDDQMLLQAADRLKQYTFEVLRANQHLVQ